MNLFIDADSNPQTGWEGYDYRVAENKLMKWEDGKWISLPLNISLQQNENKLELSIPRKLLSVNNKHLTFDFKWSDNATQTDDIISVATTGDTAPNRRFSYRFKWERK